MRDLPVIRDLWNRANHVGLEKSHGRVTVEPAWTLGVTDSTYNSGSRGPYRWWHTEGETRPSVGEVEIPNVISIDTDSSLDQDAATCSIQLYNQFHSPIGTAPIRIDTLGEPGYFSFEYGVSLEAQALFGQSENAWRDVLIPNALLRTYQGYGGWTVDGDRMVADPLEDAIDNGFIALTGTWLITNVSLASSGKINLKCKDMGKLLIDQMVYVPLVPWRYYPLEYCRFYEQVDDVYGPASPPENVPTVPGRGGSGEPVAATYADSNIDRWLGGSDSTLHGTNPSNVVDGDPDTYSTSEGTIYHDRIYARNWWEIDTGGQPIDQIIIHPRQGFGTTWISIYEDGEWQGARQIPWDDGNGDGQSDSLAAVQTAAVSDVDINYVSRSGVTNGESQIIELDRVYNADRIRVTTIPMWDSGIGPYTYRSQLTELGATFGGGSRTSGEMTGSPGPGAVFGPRGNPAFAQVPTGETITTIVDGNILDWTDVVHDLLMWSGFTVFGSAAPSTWGLIETTGTWPEECLEEDVFDKKSVHDALLVIKEALGYILYVDEEGRVHFHSPNWWAPGNFDDAGQAADVLTLLDEHVIIDYSSEFNDEDVRSEVIVGAEIPGIEDETTNYYRFRPASLFASQPDLLRGMTRPAIWINENFGAVEEQQMMAALIALHIYFNSRTNRMTILANPEIQIDDQIFAVERVTSQSYRHYVRSISSKMNLESGEYFMSLTTNWLGDAHNETWAYDREALLALVDSSAGPLNRHPQSTVMRYPPGGGIAPDRDLFPAANRPLDPNTSGQGPTIPFGP